MNSITRRERQRQLQWLGSVSRTRFSRGIPQLHHWKYAGFCLMQQNPATILQILKLPVFAGPHFSVLVFAASPVKQFFTLVLQQR
jgi:hypothetical protein